MRFADWLARREPADAAARSTDLADRLARRPGAVVHDLGSGTGSMRRWLSPRLPTPQHWTLHDQDPALLTLAMADVAPAGTGALGTAGGGPAGGRRAGGGPAGGGGTVATRIGDVTRLGPGDLAGTDLVTVSALLDLFTAAELERVVAACAGVPALLTLSVTGRVRLTPTDPLDAELEAAFNDHQRRGGRLGPDAPTAAAAAFRRQGATVEVRPSPWRLGPEQADLAAAWFRGWVAAACEQHPDLTTPAIPYAARRLVDGFSAEIDHADLLAVPH